jgi:hypothetical protein
MINMSLKKRCFSFIEFLYLHMKIYMFKRNVLIVYLLGFVLLILVELVLHRQILHRVLD